MNLNILRRSMIFHGMKDCLILEALKCLEASQCFYSKNSCILDTGDIINEVGIIVSGEANIVVDTAAGNRSIIAKLLPGDVYGEAIVCSGVQKSSSRIIATKNCHIVKMQMENIVQWGQTKCNFRSTIIENLLRLSANRCVSLNRKMDILSHKGVRERVLLYLSDEMDKCQNHEFSIKFSRTELAEYLQLDRSALSRELGRMRDDGIIEYNRSNFLILKPQELEQLRI